MPTARKSTTSNTKPKASTATQTRPKADPKPQAAPEAPAKPKRTRQPVETVMTPMEPPARSMTGGPGAKPRFTDEVAKLKEKPNEWFLFQRRPNVLTANTVATGIRTGKGLAAFRGAKWEVVVRGVEIYVKYLGEKD